MAGIKGSNKFYAKAKVRGKLITKRFYATSWADAQNKAKALFPRHKPNNISLGFSDYRAKMPKC